MATTPKAKAKTAAKKKPVVGRKKPATLKSQVLADTAPAPKKWLGPLQDGGWLECDYNPKEQVYWPCRPVSASEVPESEGGQKKGY